MTRRFAWCCRWPVGTPGQVTTGLLTSGHAVRETVPRIDGRRGGGAMTDGVSSDIASSQPVAARDFDGLYKALLEAHPRDALRLLCGARLDGRAVVLDGPTEQPRQRSRQRDKVFLVRHGEGVPAIFIMSRFRSSGLRISRSGWWLTGRPWRSSTGVRIIESGRWWSGRWVEVFRAVSVVTRLGLTTGRSTYRMIWMLAGFWRARWRRWRCGRRSRRLISWSGLPIGSRRLVRSRSSWSRSSWVCSWEVRWRPRFLKHCEGEA